MNIDLIPELQQVIYEAATSGKLANPETLTAIMAMFPNCPHCKHPGTWGAVVAKPDGTFGAALISPHQYWSADFVSDNLANRELRRQGAQIDRMEKGCSGREN